LVALALAARGADRTEAEGSATAFGAPSVAALATWTLLAAAIVGAPFRWLGDAWDAGAPAAVSAGDAIARTLELTGLAFPLALLALAALLAASAASADAIALGFAALLAAGAALAGLHAYAADAAGPLGLAAGALLLLAAL